MSIPTETQIAQAKANVGKVGVSIQYPTVRFVIDYYIIIDGQISYRVKYLPDGAGGYQPGVDTKILLDAHAYENLATGEIHVSDHNVIRGPLTNLYDTIELNSPFDRCFFLTVSQKNPKWIDASDSDEYLARYSAEAARSLGLMYLHAADLLDEKK